MKTLKNSDITFIQAKNKDEYCKVFEYEGEVYRGVYEAGKMHIVNMLESGFIEELSSRGLFPKTKIATFLHKDFSVILKHEMVSPILFPHEWSPSMLKQAALLVLEVACLAKKYGYNMKDSHGLNILFLGVKPIYVDIGSFIPNERGVTGWFAYEEFVRAYQYPLTMHASGNHYLAVMSRFSGNLINHKEFTLYKNPLYRNFFKKILEYTIFVRCLPIRLTNLSNASIDCLDKGNNIKKLTRLMKRTMELFSSFIPNNNLNLVRKRIEKINISNESSKWGNYHSELGAKRQRFDRIIEIVNGIEVSFQNALDIAGNQGDFSRVLLANTSIEQVICLDYDLTAIDNGYNRSILKEDNGIVFGSCDCFSPTIKSGFKPPSERFKSNAVFCLAVTHHLLLSQGYSIKNVFNIISEYSSGHVFIEFMPKGLWVTGGKVSIPDWYTLDWFKDHFSERFILLGYEQIASNNILFWGKNVVNNK